MKVQRAFRFLAVSLPTLALSLPAAHAAVITAQASGVDLLGNPLAASAQFTTGAGRIEIVLSNELDADVIRTSAQFVSDIEFTLSNDAGTVGSTTASGQLGNISGAPNPGVVTYVAGSPTRWLGVGGGNFDVTGDTVTLEVVGGGQPSQMIGPSIANGGTYTNANVGLEPFNPYVIGPATFLLNLSDVTSDTTVTAATFSFGTRPDTFLPAQIPEPASLALLGGALLGMSLLLRHKRA